MKIQMADQDKRLIREAKGGNKQAFGRLAMKYHKKVLFLSYDLVGNYEDARDLAQDVFIKAFEKLAQFQERAQFSTWLYRITVNTAFDFHRRRKKNDQPSIRKNISEYTQMEDSLYVIHQKDQIETALGALSMNQKTAMVLKYFHQNSTKEIAEIMGCTEGTVRNHIFRAMKKLRKHLRKSQ